MDDIEDILNKATKLPPKDSTPAINFDRLCKCRHTFNFHFYYDGVNYKYPTCVGGKCRVEGCSCTLFEEI